MSADFFRELYPRKATGNYIAALAEIQDVLGSLNDALVSRHLVEELERFLADAPSLGPDGGGAGAGVILGWQAARIAEDLNRVVGGLEGIPRPQDLLAAPAALSAR